MVKEFIAAVYPGMEREKLTPDQLLVAEAYERFVRIGRSIKKVDWIRCVEIPQSFLPGARMYHCLGTNDQGRTEFDDKLIFVMPTGIYFSRPQMGRETTSSKPPGTYRYTGAGLINIEGAERIRKALDGAMSSKKKPGEVIAEAETSHGFNLTPFLNARIEALIKDPRRDRDELLDVVSFILQLHNESESVAFLDSQGFRSAVDTIWADRTLPARPDHKFEEVSVTRSPTSIRASGSAFTYQGRFLRFVFEATSARFSMVDEGLGRVPRVRT